MLIVILCCYINNDNLLPCVVGFGINFPPWVITIIRNVEGIFMEGHKYYNFYLTEMNMNSFCWFIASQYFEKLGYKVDYLTKVCFAQGMYEFDKIWPGEN